MKPNEHMKLPEDELIAHIRESLIAHEEDYVAGKWENFIGEAPKKRNWLLWIGSLSGAAAVALLGIGVFLFVKSDQKKELQEIAITKPIQKNTLPLETVDTVAPLNVPKVEQQEGVLADKDHQVIAGLRAEATTIQATKEQATESIQNQITAGSKLGLISKTGVPVQVEVAEALQQPDHQSGIALKSKVKPEEISSAEQSMARVKPIEKKRSFQEFLADEAKAGRTNTKGISVKNESKWQMGLVVAPSFGNSKKLNMGYGVSMGYALSDRVSISSGISYSEMGASRTIENQMTYNSPAPSTSLLSAGFSSENKTLHSVDANLRGIDIPFEIKYHLSKKVYANFGVSAFAVLEQHQKNNFTETQVRTDAYEGKGGAAATFKTVVVNQTVSEEAPKEEVENGRYLGFYNLSFGYRQKISAGKSFAVEPFLKLPIKEVSKENLYLIGTGVRLKFDF